MLSKQKISAELIFSGFIGLFFILVLQAKWSYSVLPIVLALVGIWGYLRQKNTRPHWQKMDKWLIGSIVFYFILFVLSLIIHGGKVRELDLASRTLLLLPIIALCYQRALDQLLILRSLALAGIGVGITALWQVFGQGLDKPFPKIMHIQAGDIAMSLAIFAFGGFFYFLAKKQKTWFLLSLLGMLGALLASFLTTARGAWVGAPFVLLVVFWFNRKLVSKWVTLAIVAVVLVGGMTTHKVIQHRFAEAEKDITLYLENNNGSTSLGARFDMWKSAWFGIQEKPVFGWGLEGVKEMRQKHLQQGLISAEAASYVHAHNQFLHDASVRGLVGLAALLAVFFVPLVAFMRNVKHATVGSLQHLWNVLGISHILLTMSYCLSQAFFMHNSGTMFYFMTLAFFWGLQKQAEKRPLAGSAQVTGQS